MSVADLLTSQRRWGLTRCRKFLAEIPMSEMKTIGSMTERQRRTLAASLMRASHGQALPASVGLGSAHAVAPRRSMVLAYRS